jgi:hypothetical protein
MSGKVAVFGLTGAAVGQGRCVPGWRWTAGAGGSRVTEPVGAGNRGHEGAASGLPTQPGNGPDSGGPRHVAPLQEDRSTNQDGAAGRFELPIR